MVRELEENVMINFMKRFAEHPFQIMMDGKEFNIGEGAPEFTVRIKHPIPLTNLASSTSLALGEAYMEGKLDIEGDLYHALDQFLGQMGKFSTDRKGLKKLLYPALSKKNQKTEVTSHYDIGNDFYKLWLDETMSYSCGYFRSENDSLRQAQENKVDYILSKLCLKEGMSLVDIGCGWGYLLIRAAKKYRVIRLEITKDGKLLNAFVGEKPLKDDQLYTVATIDYLADGNGRMDAFLQAEKRVCPEDATLRGLFLDYVRKQTAEGKAITSKLDGRITIK